MPLRSVLDIDVNDDKLKAVVDLMGKYQAAAARMPGAWASIGRQAATSKDVLVDIRNLMLVQIALLDRESKAFEGVRRQVDNTHRSMQGLSRSTREFVGHMRSATSVLLRWTGVGGLISGLAGVLSAEGIARLAGHGAGMFRGSASLSGTTATQVSAAGAYGGILNPQQVLGQITQMLTSAEGKRGLLGVGIGPGQWGQGAGAILPSFLTNLQRLSQSPMVGPNAEIMGDVLGAQGLGQFQELAMILRNMKPQQLAHLTNEYTKNQRELNKITNETLFQYVKLQGTLDVAEARIKSAFITALEPLTPQFERIAKAVSTAIENFGKSETVQKWMTKLADGLENVDMDAFARKLEDSAIAVFDFTSRLVESITKIAKGTAALVDWVDKKTGGMITGGTEQDAIKRGMVMGAAGGAAAGGKILGPWGAAIGGVVGGLYGGYQGARSHIEGEYGKERATGDIPKLKPGEKSNWIGAGNVTAGNVRGAYTQRIVDKARSLGASDAAIQAMLAGAMGEGGLGESWKQSGYVNPKTGIREESFGHWQLNKRGELPRYLQEGNKPGDTDQQTAYVLKRLNEMTPGFSKLTDPVAAAHGIHRFERSIQGPGYYINYLNAAKQAMAAAVSSGRPVTNAVPDATPAGARTRSMTSLENRHRQGAGLQPGTFKTNSKGDVYNPEIETMSAREKRNVEISMAAIRAGMKQGKGWGELPAGVTPVDPQVSVRAPSNVRVKIENDTGANPNTSAAQVAQ